jgi:uncharacterized membrane protein
MSIVIFLVCWFILSIVVSIIMGPVLRKKSEEILNGELGRFSEGNQSNKRESD